MNSSHEKLALEGGQPVRDDFLVFGSPDIREAEIDEVVATLRSGWIGTGPRAARFETDFRDYIGAKYAVALNSCTAGIHLSLIGLGIRPGDEVLTTPMTFASTANVIHHVGARPVFVDCRKDTLCIDPDLVAAAITEKTKGLIPVHFAGRPCDMGKLMATARRHQLKVIEDAAHAVESVAQGRKVGTIADTTCFSFYVTKNVITGEGGMVTTESEEVANWIKVAGLHGLTKDAWKRYSDEGFRHYEVIFAGYKYNMMDLQAAIGLHQLKRVNKNYKRRQKLWAEYKEAFADLPIDLPPPVPEGDLHAYHLFTLLLKLDELRWSRDKVMEALHHEGIGTGIHYIALHLHPFYRDRYGYRRGEFPNAEWISDRVLSLPFSTKLTERDAEDVMRAVRKVLHAAQK
ncbi:MAG: DegT/DnrJ/EryC1/StrS aminotransferase family protein [Candidatus Eisenbacteria bacterium]|uniref:DegT/DnrJ/EryC1/StrS aminotransferase family protein n=1 Tax=Eiseniibacteriota bacterium TaxID=2212470 RepID=A0A948WB39_UNCEI|nr:DegT/DnrJ/EryC1/StrS aminotransferase family protein [Candidatus Eisenbacteria bacterium]MBU1950166.1 DegT/DnrJ/EryC1/StrS aminotransferase family protein [Candidatus Eisenbacteria bacterium]MBU2689618.1 DegT/DnrJ/EryC1/StrS aminotransferase family protein [Candidatus Eisenbacteria bacterium]